MIKNKMPSSPTVAIHSLALERKLRGETVFNFAAGEPVMPNHPAICEAAAHSIESRWVPYAPVFGLPELRSLAAEWVNKTYGTGFDVENTLVTCGGKFTLFAAMQILLQPGDEVIISSPYWTSYPAIAHIFHAEVKTMQTSASNRWKIDAETLKNTVSSRSKILILNNACNPTGSLYSQQELEAILQVAAGAGLFVISDEVYSGIVYDKNQFISCGSFPLHKDRVLVVQSCSKNFGMTGWRVGFALGPKELIAEMGALQSQSTTGTSIVSQWAAIGALKNAENVIKDVKETMKKRRDLFIDTFNHLFSCSIEKPASTIYAFIPLSLFGIQGKDCIQTAKDWIEKAGVAVVPGSAFGMPGYVRFAFSETEETIVKGLNALRKAIT